MNTQVLDKVVCVSLDIRLWSGRKKMYPEDINVTDGNLPPKEIASLGSIRVCDPDDLKPFQTIKKRAERACAKAGVPFLGGYAVPEQNIDDLMDQLTIIKTDFNQAKQEFADFYEQKIESWVAAFPQWGTALRRGRVSIDVANNQLHYDVQLFKVANVSNTDTSHLNEGLADAVDSLGDSLLDEISKKAQNLFEKAFQGKTEAQQSAIKSLTSLHDKLQSLSFLDGRLSTMTARVQAALKAMPAHGKITGQDYNALYGIVRMLANPDEIQATHVPDWGIPLNITKPPTEAEGIDTSDEPCAARDSEEEYVETLPNDLTDDESEYDVAEVATVDETTPEKPAFTPATMGWF